MPIELILLSPISRRLVALAPVLVLVLDPDPDFDSAPDPDSDQRHELWILMVFFALWRDFVCTSQLAPLPIRPPYTLASCTLMLRAHVEPSVDLSMNQLRLQSLR